MYVLKVLFFGIFTLAILAFCGIFVIATLGGAKPIYSLAVAGCGWIVWEVLYLLFWGWRFKRKHDQI